LALACEAAGAEAAASACARAGIVIAATARTAIVATRCCRTVQEGRRSSGARNRIIEPV